MIADGRDNEATSAPFSDFSDFLAAEIFLNQQGQEVRAQRNRIGTLALINQVTLTDILLGALDDENFTLSLRPDSYELHAIRGLANPVNEETFFLFLHSGQGIKAWRKYPKLYTADGSHLGFVPTAQISELRAALHSDPRVWNAMCNLVCAYREKEARLFAERGFIFGSPDGEAAPFLVAPLGGCKLATIYLGIDEHEQIGALQARVW